MGRLCWAQTKISHGPNEKDARERLHLKETGIAGDRLALLEKNLRTWISMRDLLKRECMAQAPMIESTLVLTILIPVFFLLCIAHEIYVRQEAWLTTFNAVACLQVTVFTAFASEALLLCVDANASFDEHNDIVARNKESFLRRRRETLETVQPMVTQSTRDSTSSALDNDNVNRVLEYVKYLHISNVMDTMIQKIETKDVPITLLSIKVNRKLKAKAIAAVASYVFALVCLVAQQLDFVAGVEKSLTPVD